MDKTAPHSKECQQTVSLAELGNSVKARYLLPWFHQRNREDQLWSHTVLLMIRERKVLRTGSGTRRHFFFGHYYYIGAQILKSS